jgi:hypothetical protein
MYYVIQDARPQNDPDFSGWLAELLFVGFTWTRRPDKAKRFASITEASKIAQALLKQNKPVRILEVADPAPTPAADAEGKPL